MTEYLVGQNRWRVGRILSAIQAELELPRRATIDQIVCLSVATEVPVCVNALLSLNLACQISIHRQIDWNTPVETPNITVEKLFLSFRQKKNKIMNYTFQKKTAN